MTLDSGSGIPEWRVWVFNRRHAVRAWLFLTLYQPVALWILRGFSTGLLVRALEERTDVVETCFVAPYTENTITVEGPALVQITLD